MRKRIGFLVDWIDSDYQVHLLTGIEIGACAYDFDIYTFVGGVMDNPEMRSKRQNDIFSFVTPEIVDAIIISSSSHNLTGGYRKIKEICSSYMPLPIVSISTKIEDISSIIINNKSGFNNLITHLIKTHIYRRFIFIRGQEHIEDSIERYKVFVSKLEQSNISLKDQRRNYLLK